MKPLRQLQHRHLHAACLICLNCLLVNNEQEVSEWLPTQQSAPTSAHGAKVQTWTSSFKLSI